MPIPYLGSTAMEIGVSGKIVGIAFTGLVGPLKGLLSLAWERGLDLDKIVYARHSHNCVHQRKDHAMAEEKKITLTEAELSSLVDKRIAEIFGIEDLKVQDEMKTHGAGVMATPSVLSVVRATAYAHC